jgi:hypothetical protein
VSWPKRFREITCADCGDLLVPDVAGVGPIYTYARTSVSWRSYWEHYRRMPQGFDIGTGVRYQCARCGRITMLGKWAGPSHGRPPHRAQLLPAKPRFSARSS